MKSRLAGGRTEHSRFGYEHANFRLPPLTRVPASPPGKLVPDPFKPDGEANSTGNTDRGEAAQVILNKFRYDLSEITGAFAGICKCASSYHFSRLRTFR